MSNETVSRRTFLANSGALAAVVLVAPTWSWGCKTVGALQSSGPPTNAAWESRAEALEAKGAVLTAGSPGQWEGKDDSHVPEVTFDKATRTITLFTRHAMSPDHWITTHYLRNQHGVVIGLTEYPSDVEEARATYPLPEGTTRVLAYSYCNLHDLWKAGDQAT